MASAGPATGGKRSYDMEINLVPFIDLLSCCIAFLMIVATWTQIARIDVAPSPNGPAAEEKQDEDPLKLGIVLTSTGYKLTDSSGAALDIPKNGTEYNATELEAKLTTIRQAFTKEQTTKVNLTSEDGVAYKNLIAVMDICLKHDFTGISVGSVN
jgi:biopolymer transport protein TolR